MSLKLSYKRLTTLEGIELPDYIQGLYLDYNQLEDVSNVRFPEGLQDLWLDHNRLTSITDVQFPNGLLVLDLSSNRLSSLDNVRFPERLWKITLYQNPLSSFDNLYMSPATRIFPVDDDEIREAVRLTCTRAIFRTPSITPITLGAWWARVSYLTGGVTYQILEEAL